MLSYVSINNAFKSKDFKKYYCIKCGSWLSTSKDELPRKGKVRHSYINPAGIRCDFITFSRCDNVIADNQRYEEHSWFEGYSWRFLLCANCFCHLGWQYDALDDSQQDAIFFGLLLNAVSFASSN